MAIPGADVALREGLVSPEPVDPDPNDTATTEIYTLSLQTFPISVVAVSLDRKSTRLNSSHTLISYAVFYLKKETQKAHAVERATPSCWVLPLDFLFLAPPRAVFIFF